MRVFIGIRIPDYIKERISEVSRKLESKVREARIVSPVNLHITLKFIGETAGEKLPELAEILTESLENKAPFTAEVKGAGVFPDERSARVFWIGVNSLGNLKKLNSVLETALAREGISKEENRFKEHITIARFKSTPNNAFLKELLEKYGGAVFGKMEIKEVELIKSGLGRSGPVYTTLNKTPLKM
ncbi:MAG: RNA 2',3'-cyclic phosphodiesterase [Candidatus Omnitrophica bacterium]|nr:RNA 2',3'-cyclic phosphodiesterase [Candidatus Omnitrophota bacterium]